MQDLNLTWTYSTGNLQKRQDAIKNKEESFTYDNLNRLINSTVTGLAGQNINYSPSGNITDKTDAGTYSYLTSKPNAVSAVTNPSSAIPALQQLVSYTAFMQPQVLTENNYELSYTYGADYERIKGVLKQNASLMRTRYYTGPGYEKDIINNGPTRELHYIDSPAGLIAIVVRENGTDTYHYVYSDHLGSLLTVTNSSGTVEAEQNFDAWGRRRNTTTWTYTGVTTPPDWLYRGYTGHEMLSEFNLINMNGRLYDPVVGRVLSPDNFVQDPFSTQNLNRYSYALNNPLRYTDPDGNFIFTALAALIPGAQVLLPFAIAADLGAFSGFLAGKAQGATGWGLVGYSLTGAVIGVISAGIGDAVLGAFPLAAQSGATAGSVLAYGASGAASGFFGGGFFSVMNGGDFLTGALQGAAFGGITGAVAGATQHQSFVSSMHDPANLSAFVQYGSGPGPISLPWWQRVGAGLSRAGVGAGSFLASLTIIAEIPLLVTGDVSHTQHQEEKPIVLWRGVHAGHPDYQNALKGMAVPWGINGGHSDPEAHTGGKLYSVFTSWSLSKYEALEKARASGPGGIVLRKAFYLNRDRVIVQRAAFYDYELEYLVPGVVKGASYEILTIP